MPACLQPMTDLLRLTWDVGFGLDSWFAVRIWHSHFNQINQTPLFRTLVALVAKSMKLKPSKQAKYMFFAAVGTT